MLVLPEIQLNVLFKGKIVTCKSPTISKEFVPNESFFIPCFWLSTISFFQTVSTSLATHCAWGFQTSLTIKSNKITLLDFQLHRFFILTNTDERCDNARVSQE